MRRLLLFGLTLVVLSGCKKATDKTTQAPPPSGGPAVAPVAAPGGPGDGLGVHAPTGIVTNPGLGGGGSGGAAQAIRKAAGRAVSQNELNNIRLFIENASLATGQMPSVEEVAAALRKEAPQTYKLVADGAIVLTGIRMREGIWAYTKDPQTPGGEHLVVNQSGVERMAALTLRQHLIAQQGR
jgi:hypothetical protein